MRTRRVVLPAVCEAALGGTPGRDFVGVVERLHAGADDAIRQRLIGARVTAGAEVACAECDLCRGGLSAHCRSGRVIGRGTMPGCLAERLSVPTRNLVAVPEAVGDDAAALAPALARAMHASQMVRLEGGAFVTVLGDTVAGLLCAQIMTARNPAVRLLGSHAERAALCEKWGIKHRHEHEAGRRGDQAAVVECTGTAAGLALASRLVRPRGMIVLAAGGPSGADLGPIAESEVVVLGSRSGPLRDAVEALARGSIDVLGLVERRLRLEQVVACRDADGLAVLVEA